MKLANQKLGMMRHLFILLDCSEYMTTPDLKPSRFLCTLKVCCNYIYQNEDISKNCLKLKITVY